MMATFFCAPGTLYAARNNGRTNQLHGCAMFSARPLCFAIAVAVSGAGGSLPAAADTFPNGRLPGATPVTVGYTAESDRRAGFAAVDFNEISSMAELMDSLLGAIARLSAYEKPATMPQVTRVSRAEIERTICHGPCSVKAWYLPEEGIFLDAELAPETSLIDRSILLHELVHFLQDLNGEGAELTACERWLHREREAYALQNQYLARVNDHASYRLMIGNQTWVAAHHNRCRSWHKATQRSSGAARVTETELDAVGF